MYENASHTHTHTHLSFVWEEMQFYVVDCHWIGTQLNMLLPHVGNLLSFSCGCLHTCPVSGTS